ncbi:MAG: 4-vinyl reductase [Rhodobacteraceae bacterium]|nr:4-vinyl reductase [Paracoccaceae bacterium]
MASPRIPIEVDDKTGVWSTDGLPMLYMPRHFFINNHTAVEQALGHQSYAAQLYEATFKSAWAWCEYEAKQHSISGIAVFQHYMLRISQRGWGQFDGSRIDASTGCGEVFLHNSCFILQADEKPRNRKLCYMFAGWFPGALTWVMGGKAGQSDLVCEETQCTSEGHEHCIFTVSHGE